MNEAMKSPTKGEAMSAGSYVPPKNWEYLTTDEKIERMREIIKSLQWENNRFREEIHELKQDFYHHYHAMDDGQKLMCELKEYKNNIGGLLGAETNSKYF